MKGKKRISILATLICVFALVFSLGIMSACGNTDSGNAQITETASGNWYYGSVLPADSLGAEGDFYLNTKTLASYKKTAAGWSTVSLEESGEWLYGVGAPDAAIGAPNDFYLDTRAGDLYHKTAEGWENILKLFGTNGRDGVVWFSGNGEPTGLPTGSMAGDFYLDYSKFDVYQLDADGKTWNNLGSLKGSDGETPALPEAEKVTVTFDVNGGNVLENATVEVSKGDSIAALPVPTRTNYTFLGWFTGTEVNDGQVTTVTPISRAMTLVAHWVFSGKYTFDSFSVEGTPVNVSEGISFREGTTHTFEFLAHGADDSFLQVWYGKEGVEGSALWNKALAGTVYTQGFVGTVQKGEHGEMTMVIGSAGFTEAGVYYVYMESDGHTSSSWKVEVKAQPVVTPGAPGEDKIELLEGKIESPDSAATIGFDEIKSYTFVLQHDALKAGESKPHLILGANAKTHDTVYTAAEHDFILKEDADVYYSPISSDGIYVDETFNQMSYAEWLEATNVYGNANNKSGYRGLYKYETGITVYKDETNSHYNSSYIRDVLTVEYNGQLYYYDSEQHQFLSQMYPRTVLSVSGGQDIHIKPYVYTYTYGEPMAREFNGLFADLGTPDKNGHGMKATMKISSFEVHDGYAEITLQVGVASEKRGYYVDEVNLQPTLIYELEVDGKTVLFDLIKGEKIEEESGYTKAKLNVEVRSADGAKPVQLSDGAKNLSTSYLNAEVPKDIKLEWTGSKKDFELLGVYMNGVELDHDEIYKDDYVSFAYRYDGVMEEDGKMKACFDFYHFTVYDKVPSSYSQALRIDYTYQGIKYSQYITISSSYSSYDAEIYVRAGRPLLEAWHKVLEEYAGANDPKGYMTNMKNLIDPLYENIDYVSFEQYHKIFLNTNTSEIYNQKGLPLDMNYSSNIPDTPFATATEEKYNAVSADFMTRMNAMYNGVSRAALLTWYTNNYYKNTSQFYQNPSQWSTIYSYYPSIFYGATKNSQIYPYLPWSYASKYTFGSAEGYAYFIENVFKLYAPQTVADLLDEIYETRTAVTDQLCVIAEGLLQTAHDAYHADPKDETLEAYLKAINAYTTLVLTQTELVRYNTRVTLLQALNYIYSDYGAYSDTSELGQKLKAANSAANTAKSQLTADTLSMETLNAYAEAIEAYANAIAEYSVSRNSVNTVATLTATWEDIDSKKEAGTLTDVQIVLYDAYQSYRTEGLAEGASPDKILALKEKTDLFFGAAVTNPDSYDVHRDIHTWLNDRNVFSLKNLRDLPALFLAYDAFSNHYEMLSYFSGNSFTVAQFAHAYKVLYVDKAERGSDEYMTLLDEFLAVVHKSLDMSEDDTKKGITSALGLYLNLPVRAKLEKAYKDNPSDEAAKNAYLDYIDGILAVDSYSALSNRFNYIVDSYRSPETGVELSAFLDKLVGYLDGEEGDASFVTGFMTARKNDHAAATDYEGFNSKYPQYQGWNPNTVINVHISSYIDQSLLNLQDSDGKYVFTTDGNKPLDDNSNVKQLDEGLRELYEQYVATMGKEDATSVKNHKILAQNLYMALARYLTDTARNGENWKSAPDGFRY